MGISVFYFVFARTVLAGIILLLFNAACGNLVPIQKKDLPKFLLLAFCEPFIYFLCESYGVKETGSPTLSAMIIATIPIFSIGAGIIFFKEKISALNVTGILMSLVGIVMVVMAKGELGEHFVLGIVLLLTAVISEVGHASLTKSLSGNYSSQVIVMYQFLIGSVYLLPLFITKGLDGFSWATHMGLNVWYPIIFLGVFCSSIAFSLPGCRCRHRLAFRPRKHEPPPVPRHHPRHRRSHPVPALPVQNRQAIRIKRAGTTCQPLSPFHICHEIISSQASGKRAEASQACIVWRWSHTRLR